MGNSDDWDDTLYAADVQAAEERARQKELQEVAIAERREKGEILMPAVMESLNKVSESVKTHSIVESASNTIQNTAGVKQTTGTLSSATSGVKVSFYLFVAIPLFFSFFRIIAVAIFPPELILLIILAAVVKAVASKPVEPPHDNSAIDRYCKFAIYIICSFCYLVLFNSLASFKRVGCY